MGLYTKALDISTYVFYGLMNKAQIYKISEPLDIKKNYSIMLKRKYPNCKVVLLCKRENNFISLMTDNLKAAIENVASTKDFWNGTFNTKNELRYLKDFQILPFRQFFSKTDNEEIDFMYIERYHFNNNEFINMIGISNLSFVHKQTIIMLNNDIKFFSQHYYHNL